MAAVDPAAAGPTTIQQQWLVLGSLDSCGVELQQTSPQCIELPLINKVPCPPCPCAKSFIASYSSVPYKKIRQVLIFLPVFFPFFISLIFVLTRKCAIIVCIVSSCSVPCVFIHLWTISCICEQLPVLLLYCIVNWALYITIVFSYHCCFFCTHLRSHMFMFCCVRILRCTSLLSFEYSLILLL